MEELKDQPHLFKEIMAKVKSLRSTKKNQEPLKDKDVDNVIVSNTKNNIWVRLPDKDDEDLSDVDLDN